MGLLATNSYNHSSHRHQPPAASGLLFFPFSPVLSLALIRLCSLHKCPVFTIQTASKILLKTRLSKIFKRKFLCNYGLFGGGSECTNLHLKFYCLFCSCVQNPRRKEVSVHDLFETAGSQVPVSVRSLNFNVRAPGACI